MVKELTADIFARLTKFGGTAIIYFWAPWCGPCKSMTPIIEALATQLKDTVVVYKLDVDQQPEVRQAFNVMSIPTVLLLSNGQEALRFVGTSSYDKMLLQICGKLRRG